MPMSVLIKKKDPSAMYVHTSSSPWLYIYAESSHAGAVATEYPSPEVSNIGQQLSGVLQQCWESCTCKCEQNVAVYNST